MLKITNDASKFQAEDECVVYFTAEWCGPCKQLKPQYGRVATMDTKTNYYMVDVDKMGSSTIEYYSLKGIPKIFKMKNGDIVEEIKSRTAESILKELGKE